MAQWNSHHDYRSAARAVADSGCTVIAIDATRLQLEYPLMALVRRPGAGAQFVHTAVANPSAHYAPQAGARPCAVVCLDCLGAGRSVVSTKKCAGPGAAKPRPGSPTESGMNLKCFGPNVA